MAEVSVDDELGIPIRYGAYDFPKEEGGKPQLLEQYVYTDVAINVGLTDKDFDPRNPSYDFQLPEDLDVTLTKD
jgi:outer membrane lipoprotein-sorting protein